MKTHSPWVRTWIVVSVLWGVVLVGSTVRLLWKAPSFEAAAAEPCGQLLLHPMPRLEAALLKIDARLYFKVLVWRDARTRKELSLFRQGEGVLSCGLLQARAQLFLAGARAGMIQPQVYLHTKLLALIVVVSSLLLAPVVYLLHLPFTRRNSSSRHAPDRRRG